MMDGIQKHHRKEGLMLIDLKAFSSCPLFKSSPNYSTLKKKKTGREKCVVHGLTQLIQSKEGWGTFGELIV